ncbi:MAG: hypothetical protein A4S09_10930 [Proteobacteria bacterium SG_bin7]|nr:MAG: hypothetical protein A4S09_10930 [Proteobacteria bacterium SG_bin7]
MKLTHKLSDYFDRYDRSKGAAYFEEKRVEFKRLEGSVAQFIVSGSYEYRVTIKPDDEGAEMTCSCPYFKDGNNCKHLWAAVLASDDLEIFEKKPITNQVPLWKKQIVRAYDFYNSEARRIQSRRSDLGKVKHYSFAINLETARHMHKIRIDFYCREELQNGKLGALKPTKVTRESIATAAVKEDREILALLLGKTEQDTYFSYSLVREFSQVSLLADFTAEILSFISDKGRLFLLTNDFKINRELQPYKFSNEIYEISSTLKKANAKEYLLYPKLVSSCEERELSETLAHTSGLILFKEKVVLAHLGPNNAWINLFSHNPGGIKIPESEVDDFIAMTLEPVDEVLPSIELPSELCFKEHVVQDPKVEISIRSLSRSSFSLSVKFRYGDHLVSSEGRKIIYDFKNKIQIPRHLEFEESVYQTLLAAGAEEAADLTVSQSGFLNVVNTAIAKNWEVLFQERKVRGGGGFNFAIRPSGSDWFEIDAQFNFDQTPVQLPVLIANLRSGERIIRLDDGTIGVIPEDWFKKFSGLKLIDFPLNGSMKLNKLQALFLSETIEPLYSVGGQKRLEAIGSFVSDLAKAKKTTDPKRFKGKLRSYQKEGLTWLKNLNENKIGGILADDMGLGKTVQVIALFCSLGKFGKPNLLVVPKSLIHNWISEFNRFAPQFKILNFTGSDRTKDFHTFSDCDVVITTYQTLRADVEKVRDIKFYYLIMDEAHYVKNSESQAHFALRLLKAQHVIALTGTPVENSLSDLFSLLALVTPGLISANQANRWLTEADNDSLQNLARALRPFILRRTKEDVLKDLPEKSEQIIYCDFSQEEKSRYEDLKKHYWLNLSGQIEKKGLARSKIEILEALLRLRQAACHQGLLDRSLAGQISAKFEILLDALENAVRENHKALVFSQFTSLLDLLKPHLKSRKIDFEYLDGKTQNRKELVERFQSSTSPKVFLLSLKAGGVGLNLTAADYVFILDPWWNPAAERQAVDRTHRIGQKNKVFSYKLITKGTVEEKILELQKKKKELAHAILSETSGPLKSLKFEDLRILFE